MFLERMVPLALLLLGACATTADGGPASPSGASEPASKPEQRQQASQGPWKVTLVPVPGAPTRAEVIKHAVTPPEFCSAEAFVGHVRRAVAGIETFESTTEASAPVTVLKLSNWQVNGQVLRELVRRVGQAPGARLLRGEDVMGYPRVVVVWQRQGSYRQMRVAQNNDNISVVLKAAPGTFNAASDGLQKVQEAKPGTQVLDIVGFLKPTLTVYPHVEQYHLVAPGFLPGTSSPRQQRGGSVTAAD